MAAFMVGTRGNFLQGLILGLSVAVSHTLGVGILGVVTLVGAVITVNATTQIL